MKKMVPILILIFLSVTIWGIAGESDSPKIQGKIMVLDLKTRTLVVSEKTIVWGEKTLFQDAKGKPITPDQLKVRNWVYIKGEHMNDSRIAAREVYLLPKYIDSKERRLYPFMQ